MMNRLTNLRELKGLSLKEAATLFGMNPKRLEKVEKGKVMLSQAELIKFCAVYGTSSDYIFYLTDEPRSVEYQSHDVMKVVKHLLEYRQKHGEAKFQVLLDTTLNDDLDKFSKHKFVK